MSQTTQPIVNIGQIVTTLKEHSLRWIIPTAVTAIVAFGYALVRPESWKASQALMIRDEAHGNSNMPGRFYGENDMKTAQETVLEIAKSHAVIRAALKKIGAPNDGKVRAAWPSDKDVTKARKNLKVSVPNGSAFGQTEVFYISTQESSRDRAIALVSSLCDQLETRLQELRSQKAQSLIDELDKTVSLASNDHAAATSRLLSLEKEVGGDLAELRILNESAGGESNLRRMLTEIRSELRQTNSTRQVNRQLLSLLEQAQADPEKLLATPNRLLESQPSLRRLKDGLVDAQLTKSQLLGIVSKNHPKANAALVAEQEIRRHLHEEIGTAVVGLNVELDMNDSRIATLNQKLTEITDRMNKLADVRVKYENLVAAKQHRNEFLTKVQNDLADARSSQAAAHASSQLTRLDGPESGNSPIGPSRGIIVLAGLVGGMAAGLGIVVLTVPVTHATTIQTRNIPVHTHQMPHAGLLTDSTRGLSFKEALLQITYGNPTWK